MSELLTNAQMGRADALTIAAGTPGAVLMENAGQACTEEILDRFPDVQRIAVLCGPGNNGGDGFVIARLLAEAGREVQLALLGERGRLHGDAAHMAALWSGTIHPMTTGVLQGADLVVDALFGAGLARDITGAAAGMIREVTRRGLPVMAVDVPSGVDGDSGAVRGCAMPARLTVSFFRAKPGHYLYPGRGLRGALVLRDIGIGASVLAELDTDCFLNGPDMWSAALPRPGPVDHKYSRGHVVVVSGPRHATGAARLAARGALRIGAGLVTMAAPPKALAEHAAQLNAIMLRRAGSAGTLADLLQDRRKNAVVIGPGGGTGGKMRAKVAAVLRSGAACVLDADALNAFAGRPDDLAGQIKAMPERGVVLTPHEGEFSRLFSAMDDSDKNLNQGGKLQRARLAAKASGAVVVLKGADTVIASPVGGHAAINANAPPWLATAGAGDVLAGFIGGLLAQNMDGFAAACAGVWLHGAAARDFGPGLIAEDLPEGLPQVLATCFS